MPIRLNQINHRFRAESIPMDPSHHIETLFKEWYAPLVRYANAMVKDLAESEDLVQKVFEKLWTQKGKIDFHTSQKSFLYKSVYNACMDYVRHTKVKRDYSQWKLHNSQTAVNATEQMVEAKEIKQAVTHAISELPTKCREVYELSRNQSLSYAEIASTLDISKKTVENHMGKALKLLRNKLSYLLSLSVILFKFLQP